jgi:2-oxoglutarate ferredoxin oxidoreductase subunit delta
MEDKVKIDPDLCTGCGICVSMCPKHILDIDPESGLCIVTDQDKCDLLGGCEFACPTGAITLKQPARR